MTTTTPLFDKAWLVEVVGNRDRHLCVMSPSLFFTLIRHCDDGKRDDNRLFLLKDEEVWREPPRIFVKEGRAYAFDGRHRMEIFKSRGYSQIPVIICLQDGTHDPMLGRYLV